MHIVQSATKWNAEAMRKLDILGTVEPGKLADILIVNADPLIDIANLRQVSHVLQNGNVVDRAFHAWYDTPFRGSGDDIRVVEDLLATAELKEATFTDSDALAPPDPVASPQPAIQAIDPVWAVVGSSSTTVTLTGFNFVRRSRVYFDGVSVPWRWISPTEMELTIEENLLSRVGRFEIVIVNAPPLLAPEWGDGTSNKAHFLVNLRYEN